MIPRLEDLLQEKTTIVLGAGASKPYGFPLWGDLKTDLLEVLKKMDKTDPVKWWIEKLESMSKADSIDKIATEGPEECYELFRILVSRIICEYEMKDLQNNKDSWIEEFLDKFCKLLKSKYPNRNEIEKILNNLTIITLNYDRTFDYRFRSKIDECFKGILNKPREFDKFYKTTFYGFKILHPHGCIGSIPSVPISCYKRDNPGTSLGLDYGDLTVLQKHLDRGNIPFISAVDDLEGVKNKTYNEANMALKNTKNILCIGLSKYGITCSQLDFSNVDRVYYSGKDKVKPNFIPLNMRASEIVKIL